MKIAQNGAPSGARLPRGQDRLIGRTDGQPITERNFPVSNVSMVSAPETRAKTKTSVFHEYALPFVLALLLTLFLRTFVVQAYSIPSGSMENTLLIGDHILVNKFIYGVKLPFVDHRMATLREPRRGDVIVFEFPMDPDKDYIKRIVGLPGDEIRIVNKRVYVNDRLYADTHELHKRSEVLPQRISQRDNMETVVVPPGSYFVMGDNRDESYDSRFWGFVTRDRIKGLAFLKYWSWDSRCNTIHWENIGRPIG